MKILTHSWLVKTAVTAILSGCVFANLSANPSDPSENALMGAGAHFAWIVFDALKEDLERVTGRKTILFGENSMLGVGCNAGIKAAKQHSLDHETFGFVCCPLSDEEVKQNKLVVYPLANEPIMILVRSDNPVSNISSEQVRGIFRGDIINWKEVGGPDKPIVLVTRLHCKERAVHWKAILPEEKDFRQDRLNVKSTADVIQRINDFSGSIGYAGSTWKFRNSDRVKHLRIDGLAPTAENLASGKYPYFRQLSAITIENPSPDVVKLIQETQFGAGFRRVAEQYNLLPLNPARLP